MGNISCFAFSLKSLQFVYLSGKFTTLVGAFSLGIIFTLLIIIGGFIIYKILDKNDNDIDEDRDLWKNKGIIRKRNDQ